MVKSFRYSIFGCQDEEDVPTQWRGCLGMSSSKCLKSAVQNIHEYLAALPGDQKLLKNASGPFTGVYTPELDEIPELDSIRAKFISVADWDSALVCVVGTH
jgi:hypothetical protein